MQHIREIAALFFKLGIIGFGGPAAHIAMMEEEVVSKRRWMSREHFLDLVGATNLIPGPNSTEMAIHAGYHRGGLPGLLVAGVCFILPAVLLTGLLAWVYVEYGSVPQVEPFLYGIKPAVIAVIVAALIKLGKKALKGWQLAAVGLFVTALALGGVSEVIAIFSGGILGAMWLLMLRRSRDAGNDTGRASVFAWPVLAAWKKSGLPALVAAGAAGSVSLVKLGLVFLKIGCILFGSGYVLVAFMEAELVRGLQWLTEQQLLDAIAIGQFTPGPVLSTATFVGYQIHGFWGAMVATVGIFLPSFVFVLLLNPLIPKMRNSRILSAFLDAVNASALGLMLAATIFLSEAILTDWRAIIIAVAATLAVILKPKLGAFWLVIGGALTGYALHHVAL